MCPVLKKEAGLMHATLDQYQRLKYAIVHVVTIDYNGFMTCTYGYI